MNIETREIRDERELTDAEKRSGTWVRLPRKLAKKYAQKQPVSDADYARVLAAEQKRLRKQSKRLSQLAAQVNRDR